MRTRPLFGLALALSLSACLTDEPYEVGATASEQIMLNQIMLNQIMLNGLVGSADALVELVSNPLATKTFDPDTGALPYELNDPNARVFMHYLASCALPAKATPIEFTDLDGAHHTFRGGLGLCPAWAAGAPSDDCLEIVSACLFARNNRDGQSVMVSPRGKLLSGAALPTSSKVPAKTTTLSGATIASFNKCAAPTGGAARNCGWSATRSFLGTCTPGSDVKLNCSAGSTELVARACDGIGGCNHLSAANLAEGTVCTPQASSLTFTCGEDGAFAAMVGPVESDKWFTGGFSGAVGGIFPASELNLFKVREGAFFGNMFNPGAHSSVVSVTVDANGVVTTDFVAAPQITVFQDAWACHDPSWTYGAAYMHHRLCAIAVDDDGDQAELCAATPLGVCHPGFAPICATGDGAPVAGDKDFAGCKDPSNTVRDWPLTTMLHQPCDLVAPGFERLCLRR